MKLFAAEKQCGEIWKTVALHKTSDYRKLHSELATMVGLPTFRIKRVRTAADASRIISEEQPDKFDIAYVGEIEWI